jgi:hypothetical protein
MHLQKTEFRRQLILTHISEVKVVRILEVELFVNKNGFEWQKNNKELVINGVFHEVIGVSKHNGLASVSIIADKAENELIQKYFSLNKSIHHEGPDLVKQLLNLNYLNTILSIQLKVPVLEIKRTPLNLYLQLTGYIIKTIKPPQL